MATIGVISYITPEVTVHRGLSQFSRRVSGVPLRGSFSPRKWDCPPRRYQGDRSMLSVIDISLPDHTLGDTISALYGSPTTVPRSLQ